MSIGDVNEPLEMTLDVITGPMFAGKSTELLRRLRRFEHAGRVCVLIKWKGDVRYTEVMNYSEVMNYTEVVNYSDVVNYSEVGPVDAVVTHDLHSRRAVSALSLSDALGSCTTVASADVICIDEGQFFPDIVEMTWEWAKTKIVIVSCLDGTFEQEPFPNVARLFSKADTITKLSAVCTTCKRDAPFTRRKGGSSPLITIGGSELYAPCCRDCLLQLPA
jgi:thymidine kinase